MFPRVAHQTKSSASAQTDILLTKDSGPLLKPVFFFSLSLNLCVFCSWSDRLQGWSRSGTWQTWQGSRWRQVEGRKTAVGCWSFVPLHCPGWKWAQSQWPNSRCWGELAVQLGVKGTSRIFASFEVFMATPQNNTAACKVPSAPCSSLGVSAAMRDTAV